MKHIGITICIAGLFAQIGIAQQSAILDSYIKQGLDNNLAIQQQNLNLEKSLLALKEANGLFYPSISLESQYTSARGGRNIDLPVGDMLNPVYSSLNQILQNMGSQGSFPQIENQKIQFLPNDYHDSKIRIVLPLVNAEIYYNRKIKKEMISYSQAELNVYKRELVKEIKTAYLRYLQSSMVLEAYNSALDLVKEALRVNEKLVQNQMVTNDKLYRIKAELSQVEAQLAKATNDNQSALSYFNLILNRPLKSTIIIDSALIDQSNQISASSDDSTKILREEYLQLQSVINASDLYLDMKKAYWIPKISNITDLGYQGYYLKFNNEQQYLMNIINLSWPIFDGFQNKRKVTQAKIDKITLEKKLDETEQRIQLQEELARNNLESSIKSEKANLNSLSSSKEYYKITSKQYAEGQKSLLDLLDARNQLTSSQINYSVTHFESIIRMVELERATASYSF